MSSFSHGRVLSEEQKAKMEESKKMEKLAKDLFDKLDTAMHYLDRASELVEEVERGSDAREMDRARPEYNFLQRVGFVDHWISYTQTILGNSIDDLRVEGADGGLRGLVDRATAEAGRPVRKNTNPANNGARGATKPAATVPALPNRVPGLGEEVANSANTGTRGYTQPAAVARAALPNRVPGLGEEVTSSANTGARGSIQPAAVARAALPNRVQGFGEDDDVVITGARAFTKPAATVAAALPIRASGSRKDNNAAPGPSPAKRIRLEEYYPPINRHTARMNVVPILKEDLHEADRMMIRWRALGKPWEDIRLEYSRLQGGKTIGISTLPNRYKRLQESLGDFEGI